jgi:hypothetical protein
VPLLEMTTEEAPVAGQPVASAGARMQVAADDSAPRIDSDASQTRAQQVGSLLNTIAPAHSFQWVGVLQ